MANEREAEKSSEAKPAQRSATDNPLVFISHDNRDADLAEAFANLLTDASGGIVKSFRSSDKKGTSGIEFGDEWYRAIMGKLDTATDVVALLTARSINRPWILYESGVAKGKLDSTVFGLALGVPLSDAVVGPFAQFQNSADDEDSITKLVLQLIRRHPQAAPREEAVRRQVQAFREALQTLLKNREGEPSAPEGGAETSVAKLFEEVKVLVRDVPERVADQIGDDPRSRRSIRRRRLHPGLFEHMMFSSHNDNSGVGVLVFASLVRDEIPWLYEIAIEAYRSIRSGSASEIKRILQELEEIENIARRGPFMEKFIDSPEMDMMVHEFPRMLGHRLEMALESKKNLARTSNRKSPHREK